MNRNGPSGRAVSKTRMSDEEAYERLPPTLQRCLQEAVGRWCSYATLKHFEVFGLAKTIDEVHRWDDYMMREGVQLKPFTKKVPWTFVAAKVKPLRLYNIKRTTRVGAEIRSVR